MLSTKTVSEKQHKADEEYNKYKNKKSISL